MTGRALVRAAPLVVALIAPYAMAATPLAAVHLTPDTAILLGGNDQIVTAGEVARHVPGGNATLLGISGLPASGANVVGYHYAAGHYLAFDTTVVLGGVTFDPRDVAFTTGGGVWSKFFDGVAAGIADGVALDALTLDPSDGALLLSFDTTDVLDGVTFDPRDVARYSGGTFTLHAALSGQIPDGLNLTGLDAEPGGGLLIALDGSGSVGGVAFDDEDILEFTGPSTWEMAYDGSALDADWPAASLAAFAAEFQAGILVTPVTGLVTAEAGGADSFTVNLLSAPTANVTIGLSSSDTTEGTVEPTSLTFTPANWAVPRTVTVTGVDDALADGNVGYAIVTAAATSSDPAYNGLNAADVAVVNQDNDAPPAGTLQFTVSGQSVGEGAGVATVTVSRVGGSAGAVGVSYATTSGTAVAPGDFAATGGTLNWANGDSANKTFTVAIVDDTLVEGAQTFSVALSAPTGGAGIGATNAQAITIVDNDVVPSGGTLQFTVATQTVNEGAGSATVTVSRVGGGAGAVSVAYATAPGSAGSPADFAATAGVLNWADGDTSNKSFTVPIVDDAVSEGSELFTVSLTDNNPADTAVLGVTDSQTVAIADNDTVVAIPALGPLGLMLLGGLLAGLTWHGQRRRD
jgi:hypothetical protein